MNKLIPFGAKAPRALRAADGGIEVANEKHGLSATINPEDLALAEAAGWRRVDAGGVVEVAVGKPGLAEVDVAQSVLADVRLSGTKVSH